LRERFLTVWKVLTVPLQLQVKLKVHTLTLLLVLWKKFTSAAYAKAVGSVVIMIDLVMVIQQSKVLLYGLVKTT
jgi:hypothetical protein